MDYLSILFRWLHIASGVLWMGLLYWFNFVNTPFTATMDGETRKKVVPELLPRAMYFFRWGAVWTWATGLMLLMLVFYHGQLMFPAQNQDWSDGAWIMLVVTFMMFFPYDFLAESRLGEDIKTFGAISLILVGIVAYAMYSFGGYGYRAYQIHLGAMFGTIMIMNVWMRIWPAQKKIVAAIKEGTPPDPALIIMVGQRGRHNVYLSVPLIWTMINMHTTTVGEENWWAILVVMIVAWTLITLVYRKSAAVKGL